MDPLLSYPNYPLLNYGNYQTTYYHVPPTNYIGYHPTDGASFPVASLGPPRTANSNLDGLGKFLDWNDVMRERCIELIILKIDHLLADTLSGHIPLELYNGDSQSTIDKVLDLWHEKNYDKFDKIKELSYQWYNRVREQETRHRSTNQVEENGREAQVGKKIKKTQEEIKQEDHWECSGCLRVFPRNNSCNKHVKTCKSSGNAKAVRKPGQIFVTSLQSLGTHQNANSMSVLSSSGYPGTPDLFTACLAEVDSNVSGNVFEAEKKQVQNPVYPFEQDNSALIWKL
eukprot:GFUD01041015.1.p1 GENE.GFUD01041015.1~~GFUD01041015.1.p1  ORF type:complete len:285 (+),score=34.66 GFUD01041015.1:74-928(+)